MYGRFWVFTEASARLLPLPENALPPWSRNSRRQRGSSWRWPPIPKRLGARVVEYRSCRNRHCPKCHSRERDQGLAGRVEELLRVTHSHVIFTLPHELNPLALQNPRVIYGILFRAVAA